MKLQLLIATLFGVANADVYMHNPRGANDRGCEVNDDRDNDNRLWDSQNNARGGYACPQAWPFSCYSMEYNETGRDWCNTMLGLDYRNKVTGLVDGNMDDLTEYETADGKPVVDREGVNHPLGTKTPRMYFYEGSVLQIEWTQQHGCGENPRVNCDIILQYACEDTLTDDCGVSGSTESCGPRDGTPITNNQENNRGTAYYRHVFNNWGSEGISRATRDGRVTARIPVSIDYHVQSDVRFGRHEPLAFYVRCLQRERNMGLFLADRVNIGDRAINTRQNNDGTRSGYECPEERDYYPYWGASPWKDIAILTSYQDCNKVVWESQNVKDKWECDCPTCINQGRRVPNNKGGCTAVGGTWIMFPNFEKPEPYCGQAPTGRENHLGNPIGGGKSSSSFNWTIPKNVIGGDFCVIRLRYNMSTSDPMSNGAPVTIVGTAAQNGGNSPIKDRQTSEVAAYKGFEELRVDNHPAARLGLAMNTNQFGRTFEDRSWSFRIVPPGQGECFNGVRDLYNLNVRGKRGNIVQVYPAVEYDFSPSEMYITDEDCVHVQWTGSDYNPARNSNNAFGGPPDPRNLNNGRADRSNLVQTFAAAQHHPINSFDYQWNMLNANRVRKIHLAFIGQPFDDTIQCMPIEDILALSKSCEGSGSSRCHDDGQNWLDDNNDRDRYWRNCGKLSGAKTPYFDGGIFTAGPIGTYSYMSTRSNSFSNRRQTGILHIESAFVVKGRYVFVVVGGVVMAGLALSGLFIYRRRQRGADVSHVALADAEAGGKNAVLLPGGRRNSPSEPLPAAAPKRLRPGQTNYVAPPAPPGGAAAAAAAPSSSGGLKVTALYNHVASEAGELNFKKGDTVTVLRKDPSGWWEGVNTTGEKGIFPANYVVA